MAVFSAFAETKQEAKLIKWKIAHAPKEYFEHTANEFKKLVEKRTEGRIRVEVESVLFDKENHDFEAQIEDVRSNKTQMSQVYLSQLYQYQPDFKALNLPYIFQDDSHVDQVVDGKIGNELMAKMNDPKLAGMSYTYSGGFINTVSTAPLEKADDWENLKYRAFSGVVNNQIQQSTKTDFINEYHKNEKGTFDYLTIDKMLDKGIVAAGDATSNDAKWAVEDTKVNKAKYLIKTRHFVLLTALVINKDFLNSLSQKDRKIVQQTAKEVAVLERKYVVRDGIKAEAKLEKAGVKVSKLSAKQAEILKKKMQAHVYPKVKSQVSNGLIEKIEKAYSPRIVTKN